MGNTLNPRVLAAFSDELELLQKEAISLGSIGGAVKGFGVRSLKSMGTGLKRTGQRIVNPVQGMKEGWKSMSPANAYKGMGSAELAAAKSELKPGLQHLTEKGTSLRGGGIRGAAEELSRRGWTGKGGLGGATKYLPIGEKSTTLGFGAMAAPSIIKSTGVRPTSTGEGGTVERGLGEAAGLGGMILGSGLGMVPAAALWYGANAAGSRLGRIVDRFRGGANVDTAINAPSPTEARRQLSMIRTKSPEQQQATLAKLRKYYG